ncbi:hypothetical protein ABE438_07760 [Bosea sp. TWI1241]|uniref:hypothetical protein n=1 Tax=Bosea sp. TWI1241 TaxID=3148904 RepID=UPI003207CFD7
MALKAHHPGHVRGHQTNEGERLDDQGVTAPVGTAVTSIRRKRLKVSPTPTARLEASPGGR